MRLPGLRMETGRKWGEGKVELVGFFAGWRECSKIVSDVCPALWTNWSMVDYKLYDTWIISEFNCFFLTWNKQIRDLAILEGGSLVNYRSLLLRQWRQLLLLSSLDNGWSAPIWSWSVLSSLLCWSSFAFFFWGPWWLYRNLCTESTYFPHFKTFALLAPG